MEEGAVIVMSNSIDADETYNEGERMIPIPSYGDDELIRHYSSHKFFRHIINQDIKKYKLKDLSILDLGFGTGYASFLYSKIDAVKSVHGIDVTDDGLGWARENFNNEKIEYELIDAASSLSRKRIYDYIVTRHVLEHIEDGLNVVKEDKYTKRLCINVPYDEGGGNPFHMLVGIVESSFPEYKNVEFFYEDLEGNTYEKKPRGVFINSIVFIASKDGMSPVKSYFKFPVNAASIDEVIDDFTESNANYARSAIKILLERYKDIAGRGLEQQLELCREELKLRTIERDQFKKDVRSLSRELSAIKGSKKWKYVKDVAAAKNKILRKDGNKQV